MIKSIAAIAIAIASLSVAPAFANSEQYPDALPNQVSVVPQTKTGGSEAFPILGQPGGPMQANLAANDTGSEAAPAFTGRAAGWMGSANVLLANR